MVNPWHTEIWKQQRKPLALVARYRRKFRQTNSRLIVVRLGDMSIYGNENVDGNNEDMHSKEVYWEKSI